MNQTEGVPELPDREEYPFADWPPTPPIGQLPIEALQPRKEDGTPLEGKELLDHLYGLLSRRWALTKTDVFNENAWMITGKINSNQKIPEEWFVQLVILTLEGKGPNEIATVYGVDLLSDEELEMNGDYVGPAPNLISRHKKDKLSPLAKEIGNYVQRTGRKLQLLSFPELDPNTGKETRTSMKIEEMRKKLGLQHRIQLFNVASDALPHKNGEGFYNFDTAIDILYRSIIKEQSDTGIEAHIKNESSKSYKPGTQPGNNVNQLRLSLLSTRVLDLREWKKTLKLEKTSAPDIAAKLLAGETYAQISKEYSKIDPEKKEPTVASFVHRQGAKALAHLSEDDIGILFPKPKGAWSLNVASFIFYYGKVTHSEAIDMATAIHYRSSHASQDK